LIISMTGVQEKAALQLASTDCTPCVGGWEAIHHNEEK